MLAALVANNGVVAQNILSNCGSPSDHMKDVTVSSPSGGSNPFTVTLAGNLDEDIKEGFLDLDLNVVAAGVINVPLKSRFHFTYTPGLVKGPLSLKIGPVSVPWLPGTNKVTGTLKLADSNNQPVSCLNLNVPMMERAMPIEVAPVNVGSVPIVSCSSPNDHIKNFHYVKTGDKLTLGGNLDEHVSTFSLKLAARVAIGWFPIPVDVMIPVEYEPGFVQGPFEITATNQTMSQVDGQPMEGVDLAGTLKGNDGNGGELFCLKLDLPLTGAGKVFV